MDVYRVALGELKVVEWDHTLHTHWGHASSAIERLDDELRQLAATLRAGRVSIFLSDPNPEASFRQKVCPEYKAHRKMALRPMLWAPLRKHLEEEWGARWFPSLEGDDAVAIAATAPQHPDLPEERIIVSGDKDFFTVPGLFYNTTHPTDGVQTITPEAADRYHLFQTLVGDRVDNYPGCPGIGPVKAEAILDGGWPAIVAAFEKKGLTEADALRNARLARILRWGEYDETTGEVTLWSPPEEGE
jgi:DNA polymerase-1